MNIKNKINLKFLIYLATFGVLITSFEKELFCPIVSLSQTEIDKRISNIKREVIQTRKEYEKATKEIHNQTQFRNPETAAMSYEKLFSTESFDQDLDNNFAFHTISPQRIESRQNNKEAKIKTFFQQAYKILNERYSNIMSSHFHEFTCLENSSIKSFLASLGFSESQILKLTQESTLEDMGKYFDTELAREEVLKLRENYKITANQIVQAVSARVYNTESNSNNWVWHNITQQDLDSIRHKKQELYVSYMNILSNIATKYSPEENMLSFLQYSLYFSDEETKELFSKV